LTAEVSEGHAEDADFVTQPAAVIYALVVVGLTGILVGPYKKLLVAEVSEGHAEDDAGPLCSQWHSACCRALRGQPTCRGIAREGFQVAAPGGANPMLMLSSISTVTGLSEEEAVSVESVPAGGFPATRHSIIAAVQSRDQGEKSRALDAITSAYWKPVYKYLRLRWELDSADAQDLTQEFFLRLVEKDFLQSYDSSRGRLRTFLRCCADRMFLNRLRDERRLKRGPHPSVYCDFDEAEKELARFTIPTSDTVEGYIEREWVRELFVQCVDQLRNHYLSTGKRIHFALFERYDLTEHQDGKPSYVQLAEEFRISLTDVTNYLAAARRLFRRFVLQQLREMTMNERDFQREARALLGVAAE